MDKAHPRSRGENDEVVAVVLPLLGSSPLTRGKLGFCSHVEQVQRLIPAHAGKTKSRYRSTSAITAHPRSRGENNRFSDGQKLATGSSPLTRGKPVRVGWCLARARLIPAHAGKTGCGLPQLRRSWAHPRSRGENVLVPHVVIFWSGSSPLTRGKLRD